MIILPGFLVISQPDLGTGLTIILLGLSILFFVGISLKFVIFCFIVHTSSVPLIFNQLENIKRIDLVFLNPETDSLVVTKLYNQNCYWIWRVLRYLLGSQSRANYLSENTLTLSTLISEELGFWTISIILFSILIISLMKTLFRVESLFPK